MGLSQINYISNNVKNSISPIADPYSEANTIRGAKGFVDNGLLNTIGLPNIVYGDDFPGIGMKSEPEYTGQSEYIYLHYPPGMEWALYIGKLIFGSDNNLLPRLIPILFTLLSFYFFYLQTSKLLNPEKAFLLLLLLAMLPMTTNMMHGLHHQSYGLALFFLNIATGINILDKIKNINFISFDDFKEAILKFKLEFFLIFLVSFISGWFTFDQFFLASFGIIALFPYFTEETREAKRKFLFLIFLTTFGFGLAHLLHFLQVSIYLGSFKEAANDIFFAAKKRAGAEGGLKWVATLQWYLILMRDEKYAYIYTHLFWLLTFLSACCSIAKIKFQKTNQTLISINSSITNKHFKSVFLSFLVSIGWLTAMKQHASYHTHFIPRTFYPIYMFWAIAIFDSFKFSLQDLKQTVNSKRYYCLFLFIIFTYWAGIDNYPGKIDVYVINLLGANNYLGVIARKIEAYWHYRDFIYSFVTLSTCSILFIFIHTIAEISENYIKKNYQQKDSQIPFRDNIIYIISSALLCLFFYFILSKYYLVDIESKKILISIYSIISLILFLIIKPFYKGILAVNK